MRLHSHPRGYRHPLPRRRGSRGTSRCGTGVFSSGYSSGTDEPGVSLKAKTDSGMPQRLSSVPCATLVTSQPHPARQIDMDQLKPHTVACQCCELEWPERLTSAVRNAHLLIRGWRCRMCDEHQGDEIKKAHDHENEVRIRWGNTVDELHTAQDAADRYKAQTLAALRSRDQILEQFGKLARYHRPTDYGCICGKRNCEELSIIDAERITDHIVRMYKRGVG